jgi:hypothetical protein
MKSFFHSVGKHACRYLYTACPVAFQSLLCFSSFPKPRTALRRCFIIIPIILSASSAMAAFIMIYSTLDSAFMQASKFCIAAAAGSLKFRALLHADYLPFNAVQVSTHPAPQIIMIIGIAAITMNQGIRLRILTGRIRNIVITTTVCAHGAYIASLFIWRIPHTASKAMLSALLHGRPIFHRVRNVRLIEAL